MSDEGDEDVRGRRRTRRSGKGVGRGDGCGEPARPAAAVTAACFRGAIMTQAREVRIWFAHFVGR